MFDLAVCGGHIVTGCGVHRADIYVRGGIIKEISVDEKSAAATLDATGKLIFPGIVDVHVHPMYADRMDTFSISAAFGGTTTIMPFVGSFRAWGGDGDALAAIDRFVEDALKSSLIDFGLHLALVSQDMANLRNIVEGALDRGVSSFKVFMAYSRRGMKLEDLEIMRVMQEVSHAGGLLMAHAENGAIIDFLIDRFLREGKTGPEFFAKSQPSLAEAEALFRVCTMASVVGCPLYIVHLSSKESVRLLPFLTQYSTSPLFFETCPQYLTMTNKAVLERGALAKMAPPLREEEDNDALWRAVENGAIKVVASDAAGHTIDDKLASGQNIFDAPYGVPGAETLLTVVYDEAVNRRGLDVSLVARVLCENPAKIFGLFPKKGSLSIGADADMVIFDPEFEFTIRAESQHLKADYTLYEGRVCKGLPETVISKGRVIVHKGELKGRTGNAEFLKSEGMFQVGGV